MLSLKRKSSVILLAVSIALISVSSVFSVSAAEIEENQDGSITLTERYNADSTDEKFEFESEIEYGGKMYALNTDSVTAEVLSETPELETKHETYEESSIGYTEVTEAEDKEVVNEEDGESYLAVVEDIKNERTTITDRTAEVSFDRTVTVPVTEDAEIEQEWTFEYTDVVSTGGSSIAEIARNEPIQVSGSGSKYWNNCQAWINAVGGPTADEWCAIFVAWCIEQAGYNPADYAWSAGCFTWKNQASSIGIFKYANPEVGDAVIFDYGHTGIVIEVHDDYILTAEGNTGTYDKYTSYVDHRERYFSAGDISGYVTLPKEAGNIAGVEDEVSSVRKTPPQYGNPNYMPSNMGGYSPFSGSINMFPQIHGRGANKGNCTAYAWGRVCEVYGQSIAGRMPTNNAGNWWSSWGGSKGQTPKAGAVAVWSDSSAGHVAFVEQVNADGSILISESAYNSYFFKTDTVTKSNNYGYSGTFLGFIYPNG